METITASDWITALAILLAPLIALQVSVWLDRYREKRERRLNIFKTLMATRAATLSASHVQALNMIDVDFYGDKEVIRAWKAYVDHLHQQQDSPELWGAKQQDLFVELLHKMANSLDYDFDKTAIKNTSYYPRGHGEIEQQQMLLRQGFVELLSGDRHIPIAVVTDTDENEQLKWQGLVEDFLSNDRPITVKIVASGDQSITDSIADKNT